MNWRYLAKTKDHMVHYRNEFGIFADLWKQKVKVDLLNLVNLKGKTIAELGCGNGFFGDIALENGIKIDYGIEFTKELIPYAKSKYKKAICADISKHIPIKDNSIDVVFMPEVIAYVNQFKTFCEIRRILKPNGYVILTAPLDVSVNMKFYDFEICKNYITFYGKGFRRIMLAKVKK